MAKQAKMSTLCPNCRKLISRDEPHCPYCGMSRPGNIWKTSLWPAWLGDEERLIKVVIGTNVVMFVLSLLIGQGHRGAISPFAMLAPDNSSLLLLGATGRMPIDSLHRWWSLIAANYLHGGLLHIVFNMIAFKQLAPFVLREYGKARTVILYSVSGVGGYMLSYLAGVPFTIGASAAVCGLIGALLYYGRSRGGAYGQALYSQIGGWAASIFIFGFLVPGINNWGHGGGMAVGALCGYLLGYRERCPETFRHKAWAVACVYLTLAVLGWGTATAFLFRFLA